MPAVAAAARSGHYSLAQIVLHWSIAALVVWQLVFGESLPEVEHLARRGETPDAITGFLANSHIVAGFAILALVAVRVWLRLTRGAPPSDEANPLLRRVAGFVHGAFYVLLFAMPITGILDYFFGLPTGGIHTLGKPLFIILIAVHAGAALWHWLVRRDGVMQRMLVPARS